MRNVKKTLSNIAERLVNIAVVVAAYSLARVLKRSPALPPISDIVKAGALIVGGEKFLTNLLYTLGIVSTGVLVSFAFGVFLAVLCSMSKGVRTLVMPIVNVTKNIPSIALFPIFIVLMGIGDLPRVFVIIWNSAYPVISSTLDGVRAVDKEIIEAAQNAGATKWQMYRHVKIPLSTVRIFEGLKISASNGFVAIVVAEMLGATKGLGYMVVWSTNAFKYSEMYVYIIVIALIGYVINKLIEKIISFTERRLYS